MNLPELPKPVREMVKVHQPAEYNEWVVTSARYTDDQMREYGALCRQQALEEAANIDFRHLFGLTSDQSYECSEAIRSLK